MGAYGYGPFDNDDAGDFWYTIRESKNPMKYLEDALNDHRSWKEHERRAAAAFVDFMSQFDRRSVTRLKRLAATALEELRKDEGFTGDWTSPATIKRRLNSEIKRLRG